MSDNGGTEMASHALSRIGESEVRTASSLVWRGQVYDLGLDLGIGVPQGEASGFTPFSLRWVHLPDPTAGTDRYQYVAEAITCTPHIGTHIDGLMHALSGSRTFGDHTLHEVLDPERGFTTNGIETVPPIVTRAIVLDVARSFGMPVLPDGYEITPSDLEGVLEAKESTISSGDAVLVRTGKARTYGVDNAAYERSAPGIGREASVWLFEKGMAVLGTDTAGTDPIPLSQPTRTTHQAMLVERGVHLIENLNLEKVTEDGVIEGMFVCLPLRICGASGSWVRPIVIV